MKAFSRQFLILGELLHLQPGKFSAVVNSSGLTEYDVVLLGERFLSVLRKAFPSNKRAKKKKILISLQSSLIAKRMTDRQVSKDLQTVRNVH
jgi:hypothetical protein